MLATPVAFFVFNRPELTKKVFAAIREVKPRKLLVVADGSRPEKTGEKERCEAVHRIIEMVDWDCEILKNYSHVNMGCRARVSSGLDWVFKNVEEAIILEDDCLPHPTFFSFSEELLGKYRYDKRIMSISGNNFQFGRKRNNFSYYFSHYCHIWGWATWRRAWQNYNVDIPLWPEIKDGKWLHDIFPDKGVRAYWINAFDGAYDGTIDTWDYQFEFACIVNSGLSILPNVNLVSNIGFGANATKTKEITQFSNMPREEMYFPLNHPHFIVRDKIADNFTEKNQYVFHPLIVLGIIKLKDLFLRN